MDKEKIVLNLFQIGAIKFGDFILKSGISSPIYIDLRITVSYPKILETIADAFIELSNGKNFDFVCGVPYTALPFATIFSYKTGKPMLMRRKEKKDYGTKKMIEGVFEAGQKCLIIEDLITSGGSVLETAEDLKNEGLLTEEAVVLLDRNQGGKENLAKQNITVESVLNIDEMLLILLSANKISQEKFNEVKNYFKSN